MTVLLQSSGVVMFYDRWYSHSVRAQCLFNKIRPGFEGANVTFSNVKLWVGSVMGIIAVLFLILVAFVMAAGNEQNKGRRNGVNTNGLLGVAGMGIGFCLVGGFATWALVGGGNRRRRNRLFAFDDATKKYDFKSCGNYSLDEDYGIPLFHSVEIDGCPGKSLTAWLCGKWKEDEFAWLQGGQLVDPLLRTMGDNAAVNIGLRVLGGSKVSRENRLQRAGFDAIVFSEVLKLPDIILGHHQIFETSYTRKAIKDFAHPLPGVPTTNFFLYGAVSDARGGHGVYDALADIANSRKCLIQVIGGHVVVFLNSFTGFDSDLVGSLADVEKELDFAHTIFQRLKVVAQSKDRGLTETPDQQVVAEAFKPQKKYRPSVGKIAAGACLALFGGLGLIGALNMDQVKDNKEEPNLPKIIEVGDETQVTVRKGGVSQSLNDDGIAFGQPWIEYSYSVYGRNYVRKSYVIEEPIPINDARAMLGRYGRGMKLNAWYDPQSPGKSSLIGKLVTETRSAEVVSDTKRNVDVRGPVAISGLMTLGGFALVVFGFIGKRRKAIIPSFGGDGSAQPVKKRGSKAPVVEVPAETPVAAPDWSSLSSAKYFNDQPSGMLD